MMVHIPFGRYFDMILLWKVVLAVVLGCWLLIALISLNHIYPVFSFFSEVSARFLGGLGWATASLAIIYFCRHHLPQLVFLVATVFIAGYVIGPFLEPPADPLEHLRRVHEEFCGGEAGDIQRQNRGMWQYSMMSVFLCNNEYIGQPDKILKEIDSTNGLFWALLAGTLYSLALRCGLTGRWAFLSILICFLFFGTNRFSYIRYYSFAPSFSSMLVYWLWTAAFFFKKKNRDIIKGLTVALLSIPILWVNHGQEAVFLGFIVLVWLLLNVMFTWGKSPLFPTALKETTQERGVGLCFSVNAILLISLFVTGWVLPQLDFFLGWLTQFFIRDVGQNYQTVAVNWHGLYLGGKVAELRVMDTLGMIGLLIMMISFPYFWFGFRNGGLERKVRIFVLAVLPFIGYFVPLFHFIWASNVRVFEYYRLCYASMFWIVFADFFYSIEQRYLSRYSNSKIFPGS